MPEGPLRELLTHRRLLWRMTRRELRARYAGSLLGVFWTVLTPLLLLGIFTFLFTAVFKQRFAGHPEVGVNALFILAGILPWLAFQEGIGRAVGVIIENKNLLTRARFPGAVLPAFPCLAALLGQLGGIVILSILAAAMVHPPDLSLLLLPLLLLLQLLFTMGLALALAPIAVYVRDMVHLLPALLLVWFYATPVFYPPELVPARFHFVLELNPLAHFLTAFRRVVLEGSWPDPLGLAAASIFTGLALVVGSFIYQRLGPGLADKL